tara:strand:+ start:79 stop:441 length:363 start_codon:yes stop_codon:yes gene_type:complete
MKTFIVKQVKIPEAEAEFPNEFGWGGAEERSPAWKAKLEGMHFRKDDEFNLENLPHFKDCFSVQAENLDQVFRITNLWDDMDSVQRIGEGGHSTSVGDIIVDTETGKSHIVCGFGFKEVA